MRRCVAISALCAIIIALFVQYRRAAFVGSSGYGYGSTAKEIVSDAAASIPKTVMITGATSGLGLESARVFAQSGSHVLLCGRTAEKAERAKKEIDAEGTLRIDAVECSLDSAAKTLECAERVSKILTRSNQNLNVLMLNAGIAWVPEFRTTEDGFERTMAINHLAHFLLTKRLLPHLLNPSDGTTTKPSRVVVLSSSAHSFGEISAMNDASLGMNDWSSGDDEDKARRRWLAGASAYGDSKLANVLFAKELHNRYSDRGLLAFSVNPGEILTGILKPNEGWWPWLLTHAGTVFDGLFLKNVEEGAATQVYCAVSAHAVDSGEYFEDCNRARLYTVALRDRLRDRSFTAKFWEVSEKLTMKALRHSSPLGNEGEWLNI